MKKQMVLGITGGVGAGKSTVLAYLKDRYGAYLIECDEVARQLQQPGEACYHDMLRLFHIEPENLQVSASTEPEGSQVIHPAETAEQASVRMQRQELLLPDGTFDRKKIAEIVFDDCAMLEALNRIVHPAVKARVRELIRNHPDEPLIVIEAALLLEDNYGEICDEIWYVYADEAVRRRRLKQSRGYTDEKITEMLANQRSDQSFRESCSVTIDNSSERLQNTFRQIDAALELRLDIKPEIESDIKPEIRAAGKEE